MPAPEPTPGTKPGTTPEPASAALHARRMVALFCRIFALVVAAAAGVEAARGHWATGVVLLLTCILCTFASRRLGPAAGPRRDRL